MAVEPPADAAAGYSTLTAAGMVFGVPTAVVLGIIFTGFFIIVAVAYNVTFARILFVSALDHRMPPILAKVNRHKAPYLLIALQTLIVLSLAIFTYFVAPVFYSLDSNFSTNLYDLAQTVITM